MAIDYAALKKGGFMRQKQKNKFSLRLRIVGGNLTADQLIVIAEAAKTYGEGRVHLTSRQSVEIPFIDLSDVDNVKAFLSEGNVEPGVCGPRVRTVTACQGEAVCPSGCSETTSLAKELDSRYYARELPHKFKFGVTGCQNNCLKAEENDMGFKGALQVEWIPEQCIFCGVCVKVCRQNSITIEGDELTVDYNTCNDCGRCAKSCPVDAWKTTSGYQVSFGGIFGNSIARGKSFLPTITDRETLLRVADAAIDFFDQNAKPSERFKFTLDRVGWDKFQKVIEEAYHG